MREYHTLVCVCVCVCVCDSIYMYMYIAHAQIRINRRMLCSKDMFATFTHFLPYWYNSFTLRAYLTQRHIVSANGNSQNSVLSPKGKQNTTWSNILPLMLASIIVSVLYKATY